MKYIEGGVCAAKGFKAAGIHCGVKTSNINKKDVALIFSETECNAAAVYTANVVKAAPLHVTKRHLENGRARAVIANGGNANACAPEGEENALRMCRAAAAALGISETDIAVASTGVIGQRLRVEVIEEGVPKLVSELCENGSGDAALAIMTTDLVKKECAVEFEVGGVNAKLGGIAKGSGMIHPNMGTMLCFITTDCVIAAPMLKKALKKVTKISFNRVSVDGDTSTNDMCVVLASGHAGNGEIISEGVDFDAFCEALEAVCVTLSKNMASDGEGAKHLITCTVSGAESEEKAEMIAKSVISSTLFKAAVFGTDANWGRVLCAMGYAGAMFDPDKVGVAFRSAAGTVDVCQNGRGLLFDEVLAKKILSEHDIEVLILMGEGKSEATCWGCDITYD
ncbi:MAG: bifunctional glutamate N-acetyltransferase/amino-acid acetyltransferase ArgJ, partial [Clostridiales bacterium]|nr:bifunctional glutamate N-acetyltransferase/amino-acid acetyltransferase ArgJ [Clostridiales bacterium]